LSTDIYCIRSSGNQEVLAVILGRQASDYCLQLRLERKWLASEGNRGLALLQVNIRIRVVNPIDLR